MCLKVGFFSIKRTAKKDMIVYKTIIRKVTKTINEINDGDKFSGEICNIKCSGKISKTKEGKLYLCTNITKLKGSYCPRRHHYLYSWLLDSDVTSIIVNNVEMIGLITSTNIYVTPYQFQSISMGETYHSELIKENGEVNIGLHSVKDFYNSFNDHENFRVKCIIPKGSKYYKGKWGSSDSYASTSLKYIDIIY